MKIKQLKIKIKQIIVISIYTADNRWKDIFSIFTRLANKCGGI